MTDKTQGTSPRSGEFDEAENEREQVDTKVGIGGIKTPAGQRGGPGGTTKGAANDSGLTTGGDMGTADDEGQP